MSFSEYQSDKAPEFLNLELTSKCHLKCPRCARLMHKGSYKITELPLDLIKKRVQLNEKRGGYIDLSGNYGDPIYHSQFLEILKYFKSQKGTIYIETNGSGKSSTFWKTVVSILDDRDTVTFSVDGLKNTNSLYRVNSKWDSIQEAMEVVSESKVNADWKFIVFKHNQHQIEQAQNLAKQLGMSRFIIVKSHLFGGGFINQEGIDPLEPEKQWVKKASNPSQTHQENTISPKCLSKGLHYISAEGYYFPCCWIGHYPIAKSFFTEQELQSLSLYKYSLQEIFKGSALKRLEQSWKNHSLSPQECLKKCRKTQASKNKSNSAHDKTIHKINELFFSRQDHHKTNENS